MSDIPQPKRHRLAAPTDLSLGNKSSLDPLHLEPPSSTTGLRPLGQVDGLQEIQPTTAIFPLGETPEETQGVTAHVHARRLALALDWDRNDTDARS